MSYSRFSTNPISPCKKLFNLTACFRLVQSERDSEPGFSCLLALKPHPWFFLVTARRAVIVCFSLSFVYLFVWGFLNPDVEVIIKIIFFLSSVCSCCLFEYLFALKGH